MSDQPLFPGFEPPEAAPPSSTRPDVSDDRRRTIRQAADVKAGRHPLMTGPLHPQADRHAHRDDGKNLPFRCGSCVHRVDVGWPKCDLTTMTASVASDVRAWWPACPKYSPKDGA